MLRVTLRWCTIKKMNWLQNVLALIHREFPHCPIKLTPTFTVNNYEESKHYHDQFVADGYEGAVLKNKNGVYIFQHRSKATEKMKDFKADEWNKLGIKTKYYDTELHLGAFYMPTYVMALNEGGNK